MGMSEGVGKGECEVAGRAGIGTKGKGVESKFYITLTSLALSTNE